MSPTPDERGRGDVLAAVRATFPGVSWSRAEFPEQGLDHHVAILMDPRGLPLFDGHPIVARLAIAAGVVGRAEIEASVLRELAPAAPAVLPIPLATDGRSLTLARFVGGPPLDADLWGRLDGRHRDRLACELAATLNALHSVPADTPLAAAVGGSWFPVKHEALTDSVSRHLLPVLDHRGRSAVAAILDAAADTFIDQPARPRYIHGDLHETHLRVTGGRSGTDRTGSGRLGVIDFSDMTLADPAIDVAHLAGISPDFRDRVLADLDAADADGDLRRRADVYSRWDAVFLMADHLATGRTPHATAHALFGRALESLGQ